MSKKYRPKQADLETAARFLEWLQASLGLERYRLHVGVHKGDSVGAFGVTEGHEVMAAIDPYYGKYEADVYLGRRWLSYSDQEQSESLVHEMVHLHVQPLAEVLRVGTLELEQQTYETLSAWARTENELLTDTLTRLLCRLLPTTEVWTRIKAGG